MYTQYILIYLYTCSCVYIDTYKYTDTHTHILWRCVYFAESAYKHCSPSLAVSFKGIKDTIITVLEDKTNVTVVDRGLAWCIFLCEALDLLGSGNLQHTACCMDQSHSSCHMFWHIQGHRCHKLRHACTGLLKDKLKKHTMLLIQSPCLDLTMTCLFTYFQLQIFNGKL